MAIQEKLRHFRDVERALRIYADDNAVALVRRAYDFARTAHGDQRRLTGDLYITHPLATAVTLAEMKLSPAVVAAGMLHDVPEDTAVTIDEVRAEFGDDIATLVNGITKVGKVKYRGVERYVENLRKMFLVMAEDVRVIFIKFADRLHNLETLEVVPPAKRKRVALESLEIYAPIANRLGMGDIRGKLEDAAFRYVDPEAYARVAALIEKYCNTKEGYIERLSSSVQRELSAAGVNVVSVHGRRKHIYSLHKKLLRHENDITKIHDLLAIRAIVKDVADCYAALGIIHQKWKPLKGRIKDYIAQPKPNGYQSLHTTVFADEGEIIEVQIRTPEMHESNEYGVTAHWQYTEGGTRSGQLRQDQLVWVKEFSSVQKDITDHKEFLQRLESLKVDVFQNRIFVFTPQGDVIDLPEDATPIDFAYAIHTEVGNHCTGARINDEIATLSRPLKSGDVVDIITDKKRSRPSGDWLKFVKTHNARSKIKAEAKSPADWLMSFLPPGPKRPGKTKDT